MLLSGKLSAIRFYFMFSYFPVFRISHWDYSREGEGTVSINSYYRLPQFSPLVCAQSPTSFNCLFCGGESKNEGNSHQKVFSFVGTPIYMIELPSPPLPK